MISKESGLFSFEVVTNNQARKEYLHQEDIFILGSDGIPYTLRIKSYSDKRSLAVVSVEGLCVIDGIELRQDGLGYILEPNREIEVVAWNIRQQEMAPLIFGETPQTFINTMDEPSNNGSVEAFFFHEQDNPHYSRNYYDQMAIAVLRQHQAGWGAKAVRVIKWEQFARDKDPIDYVEINYRSANELRSMRVLE